MIDLNALPDDAALLQQSELHAENDKLRLLIQRLTRHQFGRRSEQLSADQLQFGLERGGLENLYSAISGISA